MNDLTRAILLTLLLAAPLVVSACSQPTPSDGDDDGAATSVAPTVGAGETDAARGDSAGASLPQITFEPGEPYVSVTGSTAPGSVDEYGFDALAGQVLLVSFARRPAGMVAVTVRDPMGDDLVEAEPQAILELPRDGPYQLHVLGFGTTDYEVFVTKSTGTTASDPQQVPLDPLTGAARVTGKTAIGAIDQHVLAAEAGRTLSLSLDSPDGTYLVSVRPVGREPLLSFAETAEQIGSVIRLALPESGDYLVSLLALGAVDPGELTHYTLGLSLDTD